MTGKFKEKANKMIMVCYAENHMQDVYRIYNHYTGKIVETRDIHAWADLTNAENGIRLTLAEAFDRQMVLCKDLEAVEAELAAEEEELAPQVHLIPDYDDEIAARNVSQTNATPMSSAGRMELAIVRERTEAEEVNEEGGPKMDVAPSSILFDSDSEDDKEVVMILQKGSRPSGRSSRGATDGTNNHRAC